MNDDLLRDVLASRPVASPAGGGHTEDHNLLAETCRVLWLGNEMLGARVRRLETALCYVTVVAAASLILAILALVT